MDLECYLKDSALNDVSFKSWTTIWDGGSSWLIPCKPMMCVGDLLGKQFQITYTQKYILGFSIDLLVSCHPFYALSYHNRKTFGLEPRVIATNNTRNQCQLKQNSYKKREYGNQSFIWIVESPCMKHMSTYRSRRDSLSNFDICLQDRNIQNKLLENHKKQL